MPTFTRPFLSALLALALMSCGADASKSKPGGSTSGPGPRPGTVSGVALDGQGRPLKGVMVWMLPGVLDGAVRTTTDAQGRYTTPTMIDTAFTAYAWQRVTYRGETFCLRLAAETADQYQPFSPRNAVTRNFRLRLTGEMPDQSDENAYFGAELRLMNGGWDGTVPLTRDSQVEVTLTPDGPLIDGSAGKTIVRKVSFYDGFLYDLPVGHYRVSAVELNADGSRTPLVMNEAGALQGRLDFKSSGSSCGGYGGGNGVERAFIDLARPQ